MAALRTLPANLQGFLLDLTCLLFFASPHGIQALVATKAAKQAGLVSDNNHFISFAGDAGKLENILGGTIAGLIAGEATAVPVGKSSKFTLP